MKLIMVFNSVIGFGIGMAFSWAQGSSWPAVLWRSSMAALIAGILLRWWGRLWLKCLQQSYLERQNALKKQAASNSSNPSNK